uniref:Uncharacterized protein n=1 Tax=Arundo donax TaxID=35708 RepID=A0A0A9C7N6_ARUDO
MRRLTRSRRTRPIPGARSPS